MRVVHVTTVHPRNDARIFSKECVTLAKNGVEVSLVVADGEGDVVEAGVSIRDIGRRRRSRLLRAFIDGHRAVYWAIKLKPDIVHIHDPELLLSIWAVKLSGMAVVYDIHEDTRIQIQLKRYIPIYIRKFASRMFGCLEDVVAARVSGLIVPQKAMLERYKRLNRCINLPNYVDLDLFPVTKKTFDRPIVFHAGGLSIDRGLINMSCTASLLGDRGEVFLAGTLPKYFTASDLGSAQYLGHLDYNEVLEWYGRANIGLILYNNVGQYHMASAVKSFEYMASSMPIIMPDFGEWPEFNRRIQCGLNVNVTSADAVVDALLYFANNQEEARRLGRNGREYVERESSWQFVAPRLIELYQEILKVH